MIGAIKRVLVRLFVYSVCLAIFAVNGLTWLIKQINKKMRSRS